MNVHRGVERSAAAGVPIVGSHSDRPLKSRDHAWLQVVSAPFSATLSLAPCEPGYGDWEMRWSSMNTSGKNGASAGW